MKLKIKRSLREQSKVVSMNKGDKLMKFCKICFNATVDSSLKGKNDLHYYPLGITEDDYAIYFRSGGGQPTEILFEDKKTRQLSHLVGRYAPNFCPNCGRMLKENNKRQ